MNADIELSMDGVAHPYNINVGTFGAGDWPSSVPAMATLQAAASGTRPRGRPTRPRPGSAGRSTDRRTVAPGPSPGDPASGLPSARGTRCRRTIRSQNAWRRRTRPRTASDPGRPRWQATTDARLYLNDFRVPALCYGPAAHDIHGIDESVELSSIVDGARTLARFIAGWYGDPR